MELSDTLTKHFRLATAQQKALEKLKIETIQDLLYHLPTRYDDTANSLSVSALTTNDQAIVYGRLSGLKTRKAWKSRRPIAEGYIEDGTGRIKMMWFNQPYIAKMFPEHANVRVVGKVTGTGDKIYIANPELTIIDTLPVDVGLLRTGKHTTPALYPIYPESKGITSKWMYHALQKTFESGILETLKDPLDNKLLKRYSLPTLHSALVWVHTPKKIKDAEAARKRFAFEEVFYIQLIKAQERAVRDASTSLSITLDQADIDSFIERFDFALTSAQQKAISDITKDLSASQPMSRLLEGDVGSGKTAVAAATIYAVTKNRPSGQDFGNLQTAYMAPTEILAKQHFASFTSMFAHLPINIGLITSSGCKKFPSKVDPTKATDISRSQLLKWVANGEIPILIGTHALIQKSVQFKNLAYVIIDEQHRFGTMQRQQLVRKDDITPHLLSMTATPIPRTLALTIYGDLDLTIIDQMPKGRKPVVTEIITPDKRSTMYERVQQELTAGRQVYVICPRIDDPDPDKEMALLAKSVKAEAKRLQSEVFPDYIVGILHSKMKPTEKEEQMQRFANHEIDILVATSVVEVGVNVPNATVILIEGAERFGLAQLHQLRGRVIRSNHQAYCYALTDSKSKHSLDRLKALKTAKNGFELAEEDLKLRGSGELYGKRQWGISDVGMEAIKNIKMVEAARKEAYALIEHDHDLQYSPLLAIEIQKRTTQLHFE